MRLTTPEGNPPPSRRAFAASLFFAGYAPAALSACASPVTTPSDELVTADIRYPGADGYAMPAYLARPQGAQPRGAIIVVNEIFGVHEYIKDVCRRFAREGYVALAPDYFDRAGDPAPMTDFAQIMPIVGATKYAQVMGDTAGAVEWLRIQSMVRVEEIGITGFCWGGAVVWAAAAQTPNIKAGVAWYGRLTSVPENHPMYEAGRPWPVDLAGQMRAPVLGLYAENDNGIPVATVEQMRAALAANGNPTGSEIVVYPGAQHGFHADCRESYNAEAAADGWARALAWFRAHGVS